MKGFALLLVGFLSASALRAVGVGDSVAILFSQDETGGMKMRCTATAFEDRDGKTFFLTAAHCVTKEAAKPGDIEVVREPLFLSSDEPDKKQFARAAIEKVGRQLEGYDFAILSTPKSGLPVIPLGENPVVGDEVVNFAAAAGIGRVFFKGQIALAKIDRPVIDEERHINWAGAMLVQLPAEGGSSGSALVSRGRIVGVIVGHVYSLTIAVPISRVTTEDKRFLVPPTPGATSSDAADPAKAKP